MADNRRILVPIELNAGANRALDLAAEMALRLNLGLDVLHVWDRPLRLGSNLASMADRPEPLPLGDSAPGWSTSPVREVGAGPRSFAHDEERNAAARCLDDLVRRAVPRPVPPTRCLLERGSPADVIVALCMSGHYKLVVMATHGRSGIAHLLLGSVTEQVIRASPVPVLTVTSPRLRPCVRAA